MLFVRRWKDSGKVEIYPISIPNVPTDIPTQVKEIYEEALKCHSIGAWNATAVMSRRAIQEAVLNVGGKGKDLFTQIKDLGEKKVIVPDLVDVHEVRSIGKDGAHADVPTDVTPEDADEAIDFTTEFLNYIYVLRERLKSREARKSMAKTETSES